MLQVDIYPEQLFTIIGLHFTLRRGFVITGCQWQLSREIQPDAQMLLRISRNCEEADVISRGLFSRRSALAALLSGSALGAAQMVRAATPATPTPNAPTPA